MKYLIVTNRNLRKKNRTDETLFGEKPNTRGPSELRLAWAEKIGGDWKLELIPEPSTLNSDNLPSQGAFRQYITELCSASTDCVFYVHGFNKKFIETLEQTNNLNDRYGVGVVTFSWPSNPGGFITKEYKKARAIASNSIIALDRTFEKLGEYMRVSADEHCDISLNLLLHSLGNFMFERFVRDPIFAGETRIFDNIILNAADVDLVGHVPWTNALTFARRVFATINERDRILGWSDVINPDRLGNTAKELDSDEVTYFDLSDGDHVAKKHQHFGSTAKANDVVNKFFERVFSGAHAFPLPGTTFIPELKAYQLDD
jgi:esterase/lipase superfamily enzyme